MKCDVNCKYYHMCWNIGEGTCEIGEDCDQYKPEPPTVAFLCKDKGTEYCHHTTHIEQARNFEKVGPNKWMEKDPKRGEWIPCSERLPEENKTVIASTKYGVFPEARYTKEYGWEWAYESGADYWEELEDVTAWMPLPESYKEEGEAE